MTNQFPDVHLCIIGEGRERESLQSMIGHLGLDERVELLGHRPNEELSLWYNAADVFCLASSREGWANVLMESMACGTPVVATNVYGAPEMITKDVVGILVERNEEAIAEGLIAALERPWDRQVIREHVAGRTWDVVAREVRDVFQKVLNSHRHTRKNTDR
jgi:glycosyltransferase involved in cell wall biosynthesis